MQSKISLKWSSFVISIIIMLLLAVIFFLPPFLSALGSTKLVEIASPGAKAGVPVRLKIPKIKVDSIIEPVGLTINGAMDSPAGPKEAGWFDLGARPGEEGSAVIDGHFGWKNGIPAVFDNLHKLRKGDRIYVVDENGATTTFVVRKIVNYDPNADAGEVFGSSDGKAHLNLITCGGIWDKKKKTHSKRLVVFTDKEVL